MNTKYISSSELKTSKFSRVRSTSENLGVFNSRDEIRGMFFNSCHLLDYFSRGLTARMLFVCGESPTFSDQIGIKIVAL